MNTQTITVLSEDESLSQLADVQDKQVEVHLNAQIVAKLAEVAALEEENKRLKEQCDRLLAQLASKP